MVHLDLIELADLVKPTDIVAGIIKQNPNISSPIPLEELANSAGILEVQYKSLDGIEGALVANPEKSAGVILVNGQSRPQRQRFTLGHELGHFLIPSHGHQMSCGFDDMKTRDQKSLNSSQRIELEANQFSAEILMPKTLFKKFDGFRGEPSMHCLIPQASHFDVSFEACAQRYVALHDDPIAIIFSHNGIIRYSTKGSEFPFWIKPSKGNPVPAGSFTHAARISNIDTVSTNRCHADTWIESNKYYELPEEIVEEIYVMDNGYIATMLSFDESLIESD